MHHPTRLHIHTARASLRYMRRALATCAAGMWLLAAGAHAAPIYKCVDAQGAVAFQDTPCDARGRQVEVAAAEQPLIDAAAPRATPQAAKPSPQRTHAGRPRPTATRANASAKPPAVADAWECHAANGEVFYRHTACPSTIAGDGVVRERYVEHRNGTRARTDRGAWGRVPVHGAKVTRAAACQRMHSAAAAGRDGHQRDAQVSTYDRLMGRDPCAVD